MSPFKKITVDVGEGLFTFVELGATERAVLHDKFLSTAPTQEQLMNFTRECFTKRLVSWEIDADFTLENVAEFFEQYQSVAQELLLEANEKIFTMKEQRLAEVKKKQTKSS
jgi:hypothetical protein